MTLRLPSLLAAAVLLSSQALADPGDIAPAQPVIPARAFNLVDFGAVPDGTTVNTAAFTRAIAAVNAAGGGTLEVPAGVFFTGPISLCSGINLHLDAGATIRFSPNSADYFSPTSPADPNRPRSEPDQRPAGARGREMAANSVHDVMISGTGKIDGHGDGWWAAAQALRDPVTGKQFENVVHPPRPALLVFSNCQRIRVEGISLVNSPALNFGTTRCDDVTVEGITILNPPDSPNTDGIDPGGGSRRILIAHCRVDTGDDDICLKGSIEDMLVTDCTILHGHGISIGSNVDVMRNLTVRRCDFDGTTTGVRIKSSRTRGGIAENLVYEDLTMKNVSVAISLNSYYQGTTIDTAGGLGPIAPEAVTPHTPQWHHILIRNLQATGCTLTAGRLLGLPEMPAEDITLEHVTIDSPTGLEIGYVKNITLRDVHIKAKTGEAITVAPTVQGFVRQ